MKKETKKQVPFKNYIIVAVMFVLTVVLVLGLRSCYRNYLDYSLTIPVINGKIQEIDINEFNDYVLEHDNLFVYIGTSDNQNCRNIEKDLVNLLDSRNIKNETIYLNMTNKSKNAIKSTLSKYGFNASRVNYPIFLIINDKKIINSTFPEDRSLHIYDIEKLLDEYEGGK